MPKRNDRLSLLIARKEGMPVIQTKRSWELLKLKGDRFAGFRRLVDRFQYLGDDAGLFRKN